MSYIDRIKVGSATHLIEPTLYAKCDTAAATATKQTAAINNFNLVAGVQVAVKFTVTNTAAVSDLKLQIGTTTAKSIKYRGGNLPSIGTLAANHIYNFVYDGTNWELIGDLDTNTQSAYGNITTSGTLGTASQAVVTDSNKKITTADLTVSDNTTIGTTATSFVAKVTQAAQGKITIIKAALPTASTSIAGITTVGASGGAAAYNHNHDSAYVNVSGDTMSGALNLANNTWNKIGDDAYLGDVNKAGHIGIQGINGNTGIFFTTYNQTNKLTGGAITWDGTKFSITSTTAVDASISGNAATATTVKQYYTANSTDAPLQVRSNNKNVYIWQAGHATSESGGFSNNYALQYYGEGSSPNNYLILKASNSSTITDAVQIDENGNITVAKTITGTITDSTWTTLLKPINTATTASASTWNIPSGSYQVWGERFSDTRLKYTPSGGSESTVTDTGDWTMWLSGDGTTNQAKLNMRIDGTYYGTFSGNASSASGIPQTGTSTASWRKILLTGGDVYNAWNTSVTSRTAPAYQAAGVSVQPSTGAMHISGPFTTSSTTASTSTTTGALIVGGGAGIAENLYVGNELHVNTVQANTSGKTLFINSPGGAADIAIDTAANSGTGLLYLSSGNTLYINKPTNASIIFTSGGSDTNHEKGRFNIQGMFQLNSNVTQSTHKLLVNGDSAFTGKIAFIDTPAATLTEKVYIQQANNALQLVAKAINSPTITDGTGIVASDLGANANPRYRPASWKYNAGITPVDGDIVTVKIPSGADDYGTWLSLDNGSTYYPIIHSNGSRLQNWFSSNMSITLRYDSLATCSVFGAVSSGSMVATNNRSTVTGCWRLITQYDTGNDGRWYVRYYTTKAYKAVTASHVIGGTSNGYTNVDGSTDAAFDIRYPVLFTGSNMAANATNNNVFTFHYAVNIKNSSGNNITFPAHVPLYIKGTISGYTFTPISGGNPFVSEITEADDGYVYYYIGKSYATTAMSFDTTARKILWYKNGIICDYTGLNNVSNNSSLNNISGSIGDIIYWSAANTPARLAKGTAGKFLKMGNNNVPIWGDGSEVTLNGTATTTPSFYAPTTAGTNGQILMSSGTGAPAWTDTTSITSVGTITSGTWQGGVIASAFIGAHTHNYLPLTGGDVTGLVNIKMAAGAGIHVVDTGNNNLTVGLTVGSGHQNHGIWSTGYAPTNSTFTSDGKWVIYRDSAGDARTQLRLFGAVWNDYAEYRKQAYKITPGRVVIDLDNGLVIQTEQRLMPGAQVVSDTFGFAIGENDKCKTPLAVSGRVLVYPYRNRYEYHAGMAVCSAPNGTVDIMTREEIKEYPDAIVGIVSEIPQYEEWGENPVKVDGRIWIKVK